ncbi:MAG: sulfotransferase domain-containing protein, partial [Longimicrobiales bacterium]
MARNTRRRWQAGRLYARQLLARIDRLARPDAWPKKQIIICGPPRSGTSLLYNMMATALPEFGRSPFETSAHEHIMKTQHYVSKRPLDILELHALPRRNVFAKELHVVVVVRDPRDVVTSIHPNVPHDYFIGWDASYFVGPAYPYAPELRSPGLSAIAAAFEGVQGVA